MLMQGSPCFVRFATNETYIFWFDVCVDEFEWMHKSEGFESLAANVSHCLQWIWTILMRPLELVALRQKKIFVNDEPGCTCSNNNTHREGPSSSNAMHHLPSCLKYSSMRQIDSGFSGREQIVFSISISILKSISIQGEPECREWFWAWLLCNR